MDQNRKERLCLKLKVPIQGRRPEGANWIKEIDQLESLLAAYPNVQLRSPTDLFELADYGIQNKNSEEFQRTFLERVMDILEPVADPAATLEMFKFDF